MATQTLEMVSENGVLRPANGVLPIPDGEHVHVQWKIEEKTEVQSKPFVFGLHKGLVGWDPTFEDELPDSFWLGEE